MALLPFLTPTLSDEEFHEMYLCCHEINIRRDDFTQRVAEQIIARRKRVARENAELYRRPGNIQLDQCIGDTKMLAAERINLTDWEEWGQ